MRVAFVEVGTRGQPWVSIADLFALVPISIVLDQQTQSPYSFVGADPPFTSETTLIVSSRHVEYASGIGKKTKCATVLVLSSSEGNATSSYHLKLSRRFTSPYRILQPTRYLSVKNTSVASAVALWGSDEDEPATHVVTREVEAVKATLSSRKGPQPVLLDLASEGWEDILFEAYVDEQNRPAPPREDLFGFSFKRFQLL